MRVRKSYRLFDRYKLPKLDALAVVDSFAISFTICKPVAFRESLPVDISVAVCDGDYLSLIISDDLNDAEYIGIANGLSVSVCDSLNFTECI